MRRTVAAAAALLLASALVGAGPSGPDNDPPATAWAASEQVLRIARDDPLTLDPALVRDTTSAQYAVELYSGLAKLDADLNVVGDLARTWEILGEGDIYRFTLRAGLRFADGLSLSAQDVTYSIRRALSPRLDSDTALSYLGDIEGARSFHEGAVSELQGLAAPDATTVLITLTAPSAQFLYKLTYPASSVVDRTEAETSGWSQTPNSSGPFVLQEWREGEQIVLVKNSRHHSPPLLDRVLIAVIGGGEALLRYEQGELDLAWIDGSDVDRFRDPAEPFSADYRNAPQFALHYVGFNAKRPPFDDVHVRRAIAKAIDAAKIVRVTLRGQQTPANGILPPGFPGHDPERSALAYDPAGARAELALSSYETASALPDIVLLLPGEGLLLPPYVEAMLYLIDENLGLRVGVRTLEWGAFLSELRDPAASFNMFVSGWSADYPDPHNFLDLLFASDSPENDLGYSNAEVDSLLRLARLPGSPSDRISTYRRAEDAIVEDAPIVPLWFAVDHLLVRPNVRGFDPPAGTREWLSSVWLAA